MHQSFRILDSRKRSPPSVCKQDRFIYYNHCREPFECYCGSSGASLSYRNDEFIHAHREGLIYHCEITNP